MNSTRKDIAFACFYSIIYSKIIFFVKLFVPKPELNTSNDEQISFSF